MAACSASGKVLLLLIIFPRQQVQMMWRPNIPPHSEYYPWLSENKYGWMDTEVCFKWFEKLEEQTRSYKAVSINNRNKT